MPWAHGCAETAHMMFLDGVYAENKQGKPRFFRVNAPVPDKLSALLHTISHRVARFLECKGVLERDIENSYLQLDVMEDGVGSRCLSSDPCCETTLDVRSK